MQKNYDIPLDKAALKALRHYTDRESTSPELLATLEQLGLLWPMEVPSHAELQTRMFSAYARASKQHVVDNFILGVEESRTELRAGLSAYAFMQHFPRHDEQLHDDFSCAICGHIKNWKFDGTQLARIRHQAGAVFLSGMDTITFLLEQHNRTTHRRPTSYTTLVALLQLLHHGSAPDDTPTRMVKRVRAVPGLQLNVEQARSLLDLLGHAGLLCTPEHPGVAQRFIHVGQAPRKSHSSDWSYPVDFWTGTHGINQDALRFWFADHPEVMAALAP